MTHICPPGYCDCSQGFEDSENIGCLLNYTNPDEICSDIRTGRVLHSRHIMLGVSFYRKK